MITLPVRSGDGSIWGSLTGVLDLQQLAGRFSEYTHAGFLVTLFDGSGWEHLVELRSFARGRRVDKYVG